MKTLFAYKYDFEPPYYVEDELTPFIKGMKVARDYALELWCDTDLSVPFSHAHNLTGVEFTGNGAAYIELTEKLVTAHIHFEN